MGVGLALLLFFIFISGVLQNTKKILQILVYKKLKITLEVPKITWVPMYRKMTEINMNFNGNYKNTPGGTCSSRAANVGRMKFFDEIPGHCDTVH